MCLFNYVSLDAIKIAIFRENIRYAMTHDVRHFDRQFQQRVIARNGLKERVCPARSFLAPR